MLDLVRGKNIQELMETCKKGKKNGNKTKVVAEWPIRSVHASKDKWIGSRE